MPKKKQDKDLERKLQPKRAKKVKSISLGWARDDDPIYQNAGWNFLMGKNLNPRFNTKKG